MEELIIMNDKERDRMKVMARLQEGTLTQKIAADLLTVSIRQIKRLYSSYLKNGDKGLISKRRGMISNNSLSKDLKEQVVNLIQQYYPDFGPTLAHEKLTEEHNLRISVSTVRTIMIANKIWQSKKWKAVNIHKLRERRACYGALIQMDGSYHDWFEGRLPKCCLLVLIDDATSRLLWLEFVLWESCWDYFRVLKKYFKTEGRPNELYTDRHAIFETTRKTERDYKDTQFHRAMTELGIKLILALSPQAKGRVERANGILQDRLVKEMRLAGISTLEAANAFLPSFIKTYNKKFGKKPQSSINAHKPLEPKHNLERILCLHHKRKITNDLMVYWGGKRYQIREPNCRYRLGGKQVLVLEQEDKSIELIYEGKSLEFVNFDEQPMIVQNPTTDELLNNLKKSRVGKPPAKHPWKQWNPRFQSERRQHQSV
jgi:hypothetical protein